MAEAESMLFDVVSEVLAARAEKSGDQFQLSKYFPDSEAVFTPWDSVAVPGSVLTRLSGEFPQGLYRHQALAVSEILGDKDVVVTTRTSSGKSLIYTVPIIEQLLKSPESTALLFFPTKALSNDQFETIQRRVVATLKDSGRECSPHFVARYDGSTPEEVRPTARQNARVLLTNPDMAHASILAWHDPNWQRFLRNLKYIVLDEAHEYRGTFGSNVAMLIRRLLVLCARYGSQPRFIATSATIEKPEEHLKLLTGRDFQLIPAELDGSRQGAKKFWVARPATHAFSTARALLQEFVSRDKSVIAFCLSRWATEENAEHFHDDETRRIRVYRAGLLPQERQEIESGLRSGAVKGVFATSALELGIDIGALDICICVGFPNTMMSMWQRSGRVGRGGRPGAIILIPEARPIDAYYAEHATEFFDRTNEPLSINMKSPILAKWHYACALREARGDTALIPCDLLGEPLATVAEQYKAGKIDDTLFHSQDPHREYNMRAGADSVFRLMMYEDNREVMIGEISRSQILYETPPNGIYRHDLRRYRVLNVRERDRIVRLGREHTFNRTQAFVNRTVQLVHCDGASSNEVLQLERADRLRVTERLVSVTEKGRDGKVVKTWPGSQGLLPHTFPTSGVVLTVHQPAHQMTGFDSTKPISAATRDAWNGLGPLLSGMLPSVLGPCDIGDFAIHSEYNEQAAKLYFYDKAYDGIELTRPAFHRMPELLSEALQRLNECECTQPEGCFRCVRHPFEDLTSDKAATGHLLTALVALLEVKPLQVSFCDGDSPMILTDSEYSSCGSCGHKNRVAAKFCDNCGTKLL